LFDFQLFREDVAYNWTKRLVKALKEADPNHMVTIGLVQMSVPLRQNSGDPGGYPAFNPQKLAPLLDYVSVHGYDWWDDYDSTFIRGLLRYCYAGKPVLLEEYQYENSTIDGTLGSASGWVSWAAYAGPGETDPGAYLFMSDGSINTNGTDFQSKAPVIKNMVPVRQADAGLIDADLKILVTDGTYPDSLYNRYIQMQQSITGPIGFNILNVKLPVQDTTGELTDAVVQPLGIVINANYPNPFTFETAFEYELAEEASVTLEIFNDLGQKVITLVNTKQSPGRYSSLWNGKSAAGRNVPSGHYFYRLQVKGVLKTGQLVLIR